MQGYKSIGVAENPIQLRFIHILHQQIALKYDNKRMNESLKRKICIRVIFSLFFSNCEYEMYKYFKALFCVNYKDSYQLEMA